MDKELFIKEIKPGIYLIDEAHEATGYLVIGEEKACVIDTMNGYNDIHKAVRELTDKPLVIVNTHGHPDHIFGNVYFQEEAYLNSKDLELSRMFTNDPEFIRECEQKNVKMPPFRDIHGGDMIDLGGRTLEVYDLPGHTPGGILLLLPQERVLFTGDAINHHLWMQLDGCLCMEDFVQEIDKVLFLEEKADMILHGHAHDYDDISLMRCLRDGAAQIVEGRTQDDKPYEWFDGVDLQHPFVCIPGKHYQQEDHVICYRRDNIRKNAK